MIREIVFGVGFAFLLPVFFGLDGVLYSMPVSDLLTAIIRKSPETVVVSGLFGAISFLVAGVDNGLYC